MVQRCGGGVCVCTCGADGLPLCPLLSVSNSSYVCDFSALDGAHLVIDPSHVSFGLHINQS